MLASIPYRSDGYLPEVHPKTFRPHSPRMPSAQDFAEWKAEYERTAPDPAAFGTVAANAHADRMRELIPDAGLAVLPRSTHTDVCRSRRPAEILPAVLPFLTADPAA